MSGFNVNAEAVEKCLERGFACINSGDFDRAERMLNKAVRMADPDSAAMKRARYGLTDNQRAREASLKADKAKASASSEGPRRRNTGRAAPKTATKPEPPKETRPHTPKQKKDAQEILDASDYYDVLGMNKNSFDADRVKRFYLKVSRKVHPDKNPAPNASEAFQRVQAAYDCLSDERNERIYRQTGRDPSKGPSGGGGGNPFAGFQRGGGGGHPFAGGQVNPEDFINMMFGGGGGRGFHFQSSGFGGGHPFHQARQPRRRQQQAPQQAQGGLGSFLPIILMIIFIILGSAISNNEPSFSMQPTADFSRRRVTSSNYFAVPHYVKPDFMDSFKNSQGLQRLDKEVAQTFVEQKKKKCGQQKERKSRKMSATRWKFGEDYKKAKKAAESSPMDACEWLYSHKFGTR